MLRRHHYECAFEEFLRSRRIPYVAVDEARKTLLPRAAAGGSEANGAGNSAPAEPSLKSFDFVVYGDSGNLLIDIKGRRAAAGGRRLECWATLEDIESLRRWEELFGGNFEAAFVFVYACEEQPPDALFQEVIEHRGAWYAMRSVLVREYARAMKLRSSRWRTVDLSGETFSRLSRSFGGPGTVGAGGCGGARPAVRAYDGAGMDRRRVWDIPLLVGLDDDGGLPV